MVSLFYNRIGTLYRIERDETTHITSYVEKDTFNCALQCLAGEDMGERFGRELDRDLRAYRFFSDYLDVQVGDKIVIDGIDYIVNSANIYKGKLRTFCKAYLIKGE